MYEANAEHYSISNATVTQNEDDDLQGFEFDMFDEKVNYEEDQNDAGI